MKGSGVKGSGEQDSGVEGRGVTGGGVKDSGVEGAGVCGRGAGSDANTKGRGVAWTATTASIRKVAGRGQWVVRGGY